MASVITFKSGSKACAFEPSAYEEYIKLKRKLALTDEEKAKVKGVEYVKVSIKNKSVVDTHGIKFGLADLYTLRHIANGLTFIQIAKMTGVKPASARSRVCSVYKMLSCNKKHNQQKIVRDYYLDNKNELDTYIRSLEEENAS